MAGRCRRSSRGRGRSRYAATLCLGLFALAAAGWAQPPESSPEPEPEPEPELVLVREQDPVPGILYQPQDVRAPLKDRADARRGLALMEKRVRELWPKIRAVDLLEIARYERDQTRGWRLPEEPGSFAAQVVGEDPATGVLSLELQGARLPARAEHYHRHLFLMTTYDPATEELGVLRLTLRGWIASP